MDTVKQISIFAKNHPGEIERCTSLLAREKINIVALNIASSKEFGVIKFIVDQCERAYETLKKEGLTVSLNDVIAIKLADKPGGLFQVASILGKKKINVDNAYIFIPESRKNGYLVIETGNVKKTLEILKGEKLQLLKEKGCYNAIKKAVKKSTPRK